MPNKIDTYMLYYDPTDAALDGGFGWNVVDAHHGAVAERFNDMYAAMAALRDKVCGSTAPWDDDLVQFARLLCEIRAEADSLSVERLLAATDLAPEDLEELFNRAHRRWEAAKTQTAQRAT